MSTIPVEYRFLVDDAAIFPPGDAPLPQAVKAHRAHRRAAYADLVGPFVVSDIRLPELLETLRAEPGDPLSVSVVVTGGAGAVEPAARWASDAALVDLHSLEIALRDEEDLAHNARRVVTVVDQLRGTGDLAEGVAMYVEPPRLREEPSHSWLAALDEVAAMDLRLKFRTGGVTEDAFPSANEVATCINAALDRELPFKCTAGLHNTLRHRDPETGFEHHGFLNVLLATRASLDGLPVEDVVGILEERDSESVQAMLTESGAEGLNSARRWFASFGSCSVREPLDDLVALDLIPDLPRESV